MNDASYGRKVIQPLGYKSVHVGWVGNVAAPNDHICTGLTELTNLLHSLLVQLPTSRKKDDVPSAFANHPRSDATTKAAGTTDQDIGRILLE